MKLSRLALSAALVLTALPVLAGSNDRLLSVVPANAASVGLIRLDDIRSGPLGSRIFDDMNRAGADGDLARFLEEAGLRPDQDVDAIVFSSTPRGLTGEHDFLVAAQGRFAPARLAAAIQTRGAQSRSANGVTYWIAPSDENNAKQAAVWFAGADLTVAGTEPAVVRAIADLKKGGSAFSTGSPLAMELHRVDPVAAGWLLVDVQRAARLASSRPDVPADAPFNAAELAKNMKNVSTVAVWAREAEDKVEFGATAVSADAETRALLADLLRGATAAWRMAAQEKRPELVSIIRGFRIEDGSSAVTLSGSIPAEFVRKAAQHHAAK